MSLPRGATLRESGESAFVVEFGDAIDPAIGAKVARLAAAFDASAPEGLTEVVPTFRSLLVLFDPDATPPDALLAAIDQSAGGAEPAEPATYTVPIAMTGEAAEDIAAAARGLDLTEAVLRTRFLEGCYTVGMYGFAPGFAYLSGVNAALAIPRRAEPRPPMAAGSVILAGGMAALASQSMPTGWYVIGRTAVRLFRPDETPMVPFAVGDTLHFTEVSGDELGELARSADGGLERAS